MNLNEIKLIGRVTRDPEIKSLPNGIQVVTFSLATNNVYKDKDGNKQESTTFHNIKCFGKRAEVIAQYVTKGQELYVSGRQEHRSWDKDDGSKGYMSEVMLENFEFGQKPKNAQQTTTQNTDEQVDYQEEEINPDDIPF